LRTPVARNCGVVDLAPPDPSDPEAAEAGVFTPATLDRTVLTLPLREQLDEEQQRILSGEQREIAVRPVVIEINLEHPQPREETQELVRAMIDDAIAVAGRDKIAQGVNADKSKRSDQYVFARLEGDVIRELVRANEEKELPIFHIWPDWPIKRQ
jgi:hypothetical protein